MWQGTLDLLLHSAVGHVLQLHGNPRAQLDKINGSRLKSSELHRVLPSEVQRAVNVADTSQSGSHLSIP